MTRIWNIKLDYNTKLFGIFGIETGMTTTNDETKETKLNNGSLKSRT